MSPFSTPESLSAEAEDLARIIRESQERLHEIETLLKLARKYNLLTAGPEHVGATAAELLARMGFNSENRTPLKVRIIAAAERVLSDGKRRLSRELLPELARLNVVLDGRDPAANLASYLSKEKDLFTSNPSEGGWTLTRLVRRRSAAPENVTSYDGTVPTPRQVIRVVHHSDLNCEGDEVSLRELRPYSDEEPPP